MEGNRDISPGWPDGPRPTGDPGSRGIGGDDGWVGTDRGP